MKYLLIICILIGILLPTAVIYVDQQEKTIITHASCSDMWEPIPIVILPTPIIPLQNKSQVKQFMLEDTTDKNPYTDTYKCGNFADDVVANATANGIEADVIIVLWEGSYTPHAIVLFPTIDDGDVYVDATSGDWWVNFSLGEGEYNSYSMTSETQFGFKDKTVDMYGIRETDYTEWIYVKPPQPAPQPTPEPTIEPTPVPTATPYHPKSSCSNIFSERINIIKPTGLMNLYHCDNERLLQNRKEVEQFMTWDLTDRKPFIMGQYQCIDYAEDVIYNASIYGIQCGVGVVYFTNGVCHSFIVFRTIEDGDVWVDPTAGDWWIEIDDLGNWKGINMLDPNWFYHGDGTRTISFVERISY